MSGLTAFRSDGARFALSVVAALALAIAAPWALHAVLGPWLASVLPANMADAQALVALGAVMAVTGALIAYIGGQRAPGRVRTAILGGAIGAILALNVAGQLHVAASASSLFPDTTQLGALAVTLPVLTALGAAVGAQPFISRGLLVTAYAIGAHMGALLATAGVLGAWLGFSLTQTALNATFHPAPVILTVLSGCGLLLGVALGLSCAGPLGAAARRFATVRP